MFTPITYPVYGETAILILLALTILGHWVLGIRNRPPRSHHRIEDNTPS